MSGEKRLQKYPKSEQMRNRLWEANHQKIMKAIDQYSRMHGYVPTNEYLETETALSRKTIYKHLKNFATDPSYIEQMNKFSLMVPKVLGIVLQMALFNDDLKGAKIFLQAMGGLNGAGTKGTFIQNQNNYIQINGLMLSQENINQLNPEKLRQIVEIIKPAIPLPIAGIKTIPDKI